jgi:hypothetical protein
MLCSLDFSPCSSLVNSPLCFSLWWLDLPRFFVWKVAAYHTVRARLAYRSTRSKSVYHSTRTNLVYYGARSKLADLCDRVQYPIQQDLVCSTTILFIWRWEATILTEKSCPSPCLESSAWRSCLMSVKQSFVLKIPLAEVITK